MCVGLSFEPLVADHGWEIVLTALREEAARQLVLSGDPTARKVFDVLQACLEEVCRDC